MQSMRNRKRKPDHRLMCRPAERTAEKIPGKTAAVFWAALLTMVFLLTAVPLPRAWAAPPDGELHPAYAFSVDQINDWTEKAGGSSVDVILDPVLERNGTLTMEGWLATDWGVSRYECAWVPSGGGQLTFQTVETVSIYPRHDLKNAGIPYESGHETAGFSLEWPLPADCPAGYYDFYLRGVDRDGRTCDLLALLHVQYGSPDRETDAGLFISFDRLAGEPGALVGAECVRKNLLLHPDGRVHIGKIGINQYAGVKIVYETGADGLDLTAGGSVERRPVIGLKTGGAYSYGVDGERYNLTDDLLYAALPVTAPHSRGEVFLDFSRLDETAPVTDLWLTGYLGRDVTIQSVAFVSRDQMFDRTNAKIRFSAREDVLAALHSYNAVTATGLRDPVQGDYLRIEATESTNDPYVYFEAGQLLNGYDINLNARDYPYMVILSRVKRQAGPAPTTFYFCAGTTHGPTEDSTLTFTQNFDGNWHYYLLDFSAEPTWTGRINGWRFDTVNHTMEAGDYMDVATVQFFHTRKEAEAAAGRSPQTNQPYTLSDPAVIREDEQNSGTGSVDFVIPEGDSYVIDGSGAEETRDPALTVQPVDTISPPDPNSPPDTIGPDETPGADGSPGVEITITEAESASGGCASASLAAPIVLLLGFLVWSTVDRMRKRKSERMK